MLCFVYNSISTFTNFLQVCQFTVRYLLYIFLSTQTYKTVTVLLENNPQGLCYCEDSNMCKMRVEGYALQLRVPLCKVHDEVFVNCNCN